MTSCVVLIFCWVAVLSYKCAWWVSVSMHSLWRPTLDHHIYFSLCQKAHICKLYDLLLTPDPFRLNVCFSLCLQHIQWSPMGRWSVPKVLKGWILHTVKVGYTTHVLSPACFLHIHGALYLIGYLQQCFPAYTDLLQVCLAVHLALVGTRSRLQLALPGVKVQ